MAVVLTFLLTNLPYIVDEFIRQKIVINRDCDEEWCRVGKVTDNFPVLKNINSILGNTGSFYCGKLCSESFHLPDLQLQVLPGTEDHQWLLPSHQANTEQVSTPNYKKKLISSSNIIFVLCVSWHLSSFVFLIHLQSNFVQ